MKSVCNSDLHTDMHGKCFSLLCGAGGGKTFVMNYLNDFTSFKLTVLSLSVIGQNCDLLVHLFHFSHSHSLSSEISWDEELL